ncbi:MAG: hypothetical protein QM650_13340 [Microlunatus sp.]
MVSMLSRRCWGLRLLPSTALLNTARSGPATKTATSTPGSRCTAPPAIVRAYASQQAIAVWMPRV